MYILSDHSDQDELFAFSLDFCECKELSLPNKIRNSSLTHWHSQLVLVGGLEPDDYSTNKLWVSDDGFNWKQSLPPMRTKRHGASAISTGGSPEYLVVAGGLTRTSSDVHCMEKLDVVEVLVNEEWFMVQPLPEAPYMPRSYVHNGNIIITNKSPFSNSLSGRICSIESLLASNSKSKKGKPSSNIWEKFYGIHHATCLLSFGWQLAVVKGYLSDCPHVEFLCPTSRTWLIYDAIPDRAPCLAGLVLPNAKIMLIAQHHISEVISIYTASLKCKHYFLLGR